LVDPRRVPREFAVLAHIVLGHAPGCKTLFKGPPDRTPLKLVQPTNGCNCLLFIIRQLANNVWTVAMMRKLGIVLPRLRRLRR
jgi:hypothetical protein